MVGFFQQFEIFERHRRGDDLDLSRITNGIAQTNIATEFAALAGFGKNLTFSHRGLAIHNR